MCIMPSQLGNYNSFRIVLVSHKDWALVRTTDYGHYLGNILTVTLTKEQRIGVSRKCLSTCIDNECIFNKCKLKTFSVSQGHLKECLLTDN